MRAKFVIPLVAILLSGWVPAASASGSGGPLTPSPSQALAKLHRLESRFTNLQARYSSLERSAGRITLRLVSALQAEEQASAALAAARLELENRIRAAFELGPGSAIEALLSARSMQDILSVQEFAARAIAVDQQAVDGLERAAAALRARATAAEHAQRALLAEQRRLARRLAQLRAAVAAAERVARRARSQDASLLDAERETLQDDAARQVGRNLVIDGSAGTDQRDLLALLGPDEGRGCEIPPGLLDTGKGFSGDASWYGWEFAGQSTADGAIFDPRLFTAASPWLPFGTFLRVHYNGKCAIVLVNDRGPYVDGRVIDLSWAAAHYLGVGVSPVNADILVPA